MPTDDVVPPAPQVCALAPALFELSSEGLGAALVGFVVPLLWIRGHVEQIRERIQARWPNDVAQGPRALPDVWCAYARQLLALVRASQELEAFVLMEAQPGFALPAGLAVDVYGEISVQNRLRACKMQLDVLRTQIRLLLSDDTPAMDRAQARITLCDGDLELLRAHAESLERVLVGPQVVTP